MQSFSKVPGVFDLPFFDEKMNKYYCLGSYFETNTDAMKYFDTSRNIAKRNYQTAILNTGSNNFEVTQFLNENPQQFYE